MDEETLRLDSKEREINSRKEERDKEARKTFNKATKDAWNEYIEGWEPARQKWEEFSFPYFKELRRKLEINQKEYEEELSKVRSNFKKCPKCGTMAARFQRFCSNEECGSKLPYEVDY